MTKLKPCPFCGSKAKMERTPINPYYYVICTNLECDATVGSFQPTEEEAAAAWNRRDGEYIMELIDREALKAELLKNVEKLADKTGFFEGIRMGYESAVYFVEQAPTVEECKHGYWIEHPEHPVGDCSICGERVPIYGGSKKYKICPYCGAIMDGQAICDD